MIGGGDADRCLHARAQAVAASEVDARALARELARSDVVTIDREHLRRLIDLGRRAIRTTADHEVITGALLIARTAAGAT